MNPFEQATPEQHKRNTDAIEQTAQRALKVGCGMVVQRNRDGTVTCWLDPFAPPMQMNLIEEGSDQE